MTKLSIVLSIQGNPVECKVLRNSAGLNHIEFPNYFGFRGVIDEDDTSLSVLGVGKGKDLIFSFEKVGDYVAR